MIITVRGHDSSDTDQEYHDSATVDTDIMHDTESLAEDDLVTSYNGYPEDPGYGYTGGRVPDYSPPQQQQQQAYRAGSLPRSVRKESTSFEHSEPLPGNLTRWPMDAGRRPGESFVELTVTLQRSDSGFGFRIVGGTEEGSQV